MKAIQIVLIAMALVAACSALPAQNPMHYETDWFKATFPSNLPIKCEAEPAATNDGTRYTIHDCAQFVPGLEVFVSYLDYPTKRKNTTASLDNYIDSGMTLFAKGIRSYRKKDSTLGNLSARAGFAIVVIKDKTYTLYTRCAVQNKQVWMVFALVPEGTNYSDADINKFFDSVIVKQKS